MFTPQARWDRNLPQDANQTLGSSINVLSFIYNGRIVPKSFLWNNKILHITKIYFFWKNTQGKETLYFFSVQTEAGVYEIVFSRHALSWYICKLISP